MSAVWTKDSIPNVSDQVVIITGANSGLGFETAVALAARKAKVILAVRNMEKGSEAAGKIKSIYPGANVKPMQLDLGDLNSVRAFAFDFMNQYESLSILINNAGIMIPPHRLTKDGFESQFGGNHLGHFALTGLLLPKLISTPNSRVVTVSSIAAHNAAINFDNLDGSKGYSAIKFYGQSKLANLMYAKELQNKLRSNHLDATSVACHPGISNTNLFSFGSGKQTNKLMSILAGFVSQPAHMGALPTLYAATEPTIKGGEYIAPDGRGGRKGYPKSDEIINKLYDADISNRLWNISESLTGVSYKFN
ncbi:NADP-dependent 3-hydroxy acid dehydrogenase YdfG [Paenibacillus algorifonticola]|uniref:NADP-dependent 3-hydroxy acid dehydrogenase YdfG n=1 Tax=Paenibacillus algorifonticola TaxID=684063 RepID=A0A1I2J8D8_9BACL|nr:oxidoreductase [Paenibacillus algorifonticola]SFF49001.1 NADP-dependent 3-hydroxy acid dehydrogenase YdfG [Paenibacillus algorifonticola]